MKNPILKNAHPFSKLLFALFIVFSSFLIILLLSLLISIPVFGIDILNFKMYFDVNNPDNIAFIKFMQIMQSLALFVIPSIIAAFVFSDDIKKYLSLRGKVEFTDVLIAVLIMISAIPIINFFAEINSSLRLPESLSGLENSIKNAENLAKQTTEIFLNVKTIPGLLFNLFMIALIPAIGEELLFRGLLLKIFEEWTKNFHIAIFVSAFIFSFIHFQFYGFLPRLLMGVLLGYLVFWTRNLWFSIIAHFVNNAIGVIVFFIYYGMPEMDKIENVGSKYGEYTLLPLSVGIISILLYLFYVRNKGNKIIENKK